MKRLTLIALFAFFTAGYVTLPSRASGIKAPETKWSEVSRDPEFPYSEIGLIYQTVLDAMTRRYFRDFPDLDAAHTEAMRAFIRNEHPKERFITLMIRDQAMDIFRKAKGNPPYWDSEEFQSAYELTVNVSVPMARMIVGNAIDLYVAKHVDKDPLKIELFKMAQSEDDKQYIAWVYGEVSIEKFKEDQFAGNYEFQDGDRVFGFSGGDWENLSGRQGYIIVRGGKIHETIITLMN